jgi:hypothetical protein
MRSLAFSGAQVHDEIVAIPLPLSMIKKVLAHFIFFLDVSGRCFFVCFSRRYAHFHSLRLIA